MKTHLLLKRLLFLWVLAFSSTLWAQTETLECTKGTIVSDQMSFSTANFNIVHAKSTGTSFAAYAPWRVYSDNTVKFTAGANVQTITSVVITADTNSYATVIGNSTLSIISGTGTATASSSGAIATVTLTGTDIKEFLLRPSAQTRWVSIQINYNLLSSEFPPVVSSANQNRNCRCLLYVSNRSH